MQLIFNSKIQLPLKLKTLLVFVTCVGAFLPAAATITTADDTILLAIGTYPDTSKTAVVVNDSLIQTMLNDLAALNQLPLKYELVNGSAQFIATEDINNRLLTDYCFTTTTNCQTLYNCISTSDYQKYLATIKSKNISLDFYFISNSSKPDSSIVKMSFFEVLEKIQRFPIPAYTIRVVIKHTAHLYKRIPDLPPAKQSNLNQLCWMAIFTTEKRYAYKSIPNRSL